MLSAEQHLEIAKYIKENISIETEEKSYDYSKGSYTVVKLVFDGEVISEDTIDF